jgi:hypothetical protein
MIALRRNLVYGHLIDVVAALAVVLEIVMTILAFEEMLNTRASYITANFRIKGSMRYILTYYIFYIHKKLISITSKVS